MKSALITILGILIVLHVVAALSSCAPSNLTPAQQQQLITVEENALKDGAAAGIGYATGGTTGAIVGGLSQVARNHTAPALTAAKAPVKVTP